MTSTPEQVIAKIREALEAGPTPGPWNSYSLPESNTQGPSAGRLVGVPEIYRDRSSWFRPEDAAYIAACNPQNIAVLMGEITDLQSVVQCMNEDFAAVKAERDALRKALEPFAALIERSDTMDIEWLEANAPGTELEVYTPSSDKLVSSGEMRNPIFVTRGDFRRARTLLAGDNHE